MDDEWIQLCRDEMNAIAEASQKLVWEMFGTSLSEEERRAAWPQERIDRRRAELYKEHLDAAGIEIRRKKVAAPRGRRRRPDCGASFMAGAYCILPEGHSGGHASGE